MFSKDCRFVTTLCRIITVEDVDDGCATKTISKCIVRRSDPTRNFPVIDTIDSLLVMEIDGLNYA
jgi:hypothetical protein